MPLFFPQKLVFKQTKKNLSIVFYRFLHIQRKKKKKKNFMIQVFSFTESNICLAPNWQLAVFVVLSTMALCHVLILLKFEYNYLPVGKWTGKTTRSFVYGATSIFFAICVILTNVLEITWICVLPIVWLIGEIYVHVNFPSVQAFYQKKSAEKSFNEYRYQVFFVQTFFTAFFFLCSLGVVYLVSLIF